MPLDPQFIDITFPVSGVDESTEYALQTPQTSARGVNVRGYEPSTGRARGGARPGLSRYISGQVTGASHPVQHLAVIVDPTPRGLAGFDGSALGSGTAGGGGGIDVGGGGVTDTTTGWGRPPGTTDTTTSDPSTNNNPDGLGDRNPPGRTIRPGGTGTQPNRHLPPPSPPVPIAYVQSKYGPVPGTYTPGFEPDFGSLAGSARRSLTLGTHVVDTHFLVAVVAVVNFEAAATPTVLTVRNSFLDAFTHAGTTPLYQHFGGNYELSVWFRVAQSGTFEDTLYVDPNVSCAMSVALVEFKNVLRPSTASLDSYAVSAGSTTVPTGTTGSVAVAGAGTLLLGAFSDDSNDPVTEALLAASAGFVLLLNQYDGTDMPSLQVVYQLGLQAAAPATIDYTALGGNKYNAVGVTFKKS